jgi:hypothetical protein
MNLPSAYNNGGAVGKAGAVELGGSAKAAPVNPIYQVGEIGFGPMWNDEPSLRDLYEIACQTIVRQDCEISEANARIAVLEAEQAILKNKIDCLRDDACRDKCRDKAASDGGWDNR